MNGIWNNDYFGGDLKGIEKSFRILLIWALLVFILILFLNPIQTTDMILPIMKN